MRETILTFLLLLFICCNPEGQGFQFGAYHSEQLSEFESRIEYLFDHQKRIPFTKIQFNADSTFFGERLREDIKGSWSLKGQSIALTVLSNSDTLNQLHHIDTTFVYTIKKNCLMNELHTIDDGLRKVKVVDIICNVGDQ